MDKNFTKILFFLLFILLASTRSFSQTISIGTIDNSASYGQGSTIAVPISVNDATGCITPGNTYNLYLSNASGVFSPGTLIGSFSGIYTPFVNGLIPAGTPAGTGYKVMVQSTTPAVTSSISAAFEIKAVPGVKPSVSSNNTMPGNPEVFGSCGANYDPATPTQNTVYKLTNNSAAHTTSTISIYDELNRTPTNAIISITNPGDQDTFTPAAAANFTATVRTIDGNGIIGTYDYQIINNQSVTNFGAAGSSSTCLIGGIGILKYHINIPATSAGIELNYPGDVYEINWGDGSSTTYTFCQLKAANGFVQHEFKLPSCTATGNSNGVANSFYVQNQTVSPYCGGKSAPSFVSSKVLIVPTTSFTGQNVACVGGAAVTLTNTSQPGPDPNSTTTTCANNPGQLYDWYVDNKLVGPNYTLNQTFTLPVYTTPGSHHVMLHTQPITGACLSEDAQMDICFENPPQPNFSITPRVCASATSAVTPVNTSIIDPTCSTYSTHQYIWNVTGPAAVGYAGGTNANSQVPQFLFGTAGTYTVQLNITTSGCGTIPGPVQTVIVDALPIAQLSADATFCGKGQKLVFDATTTSKTYTILSGTTTAIASTYAWSVNGGAFTFVDGTNSASQYPHIIFSDDGPYTVTVTHTNECDIVSDTQQITFVEQPTVTAGSYPDICVDGTIALAGYVSTNNNGFVWTSSKTGGTFSPNANTLNATYTPAPSEIAQGFVKLTLTATSLAPCGNVSSNTTINITPVVHVNSASTKAICSGTKTLYTITADQTPVTFTWVASATSGNPTGFTATGSGSSINDLLTNSTINNASPVDEQVTYKITPVYKGCTGQTFPLVVTVHPLPTMSAAPLHSPICNGTPANIMFQSNITGTTYTWSTTTVTGVTGNQPQTSATTAINGIQDNLTNTTATTQTVTYRVTPHNGSCDGAPFDVQVVVGPAIIAFAGNDNEICGRTSYTLTGNTPVVGTGHWQTVQGPTDAFIETPDNPTTLVSNLKFGFTYKFEWTITPPSGNCTGVADVTIQVDAPTDPGNTSTGDATTVCAGSATGTGTIALGPHTGAILGWEYSTDGSNYYPLPANTTKFQTFGPLTAGTWWYRAIVRNGINCDILKSGATQIIAIPQPTIPDAGPEERICNKSDYALHGNTPISGIGTWTASSPDVTFDNPNDPQTTAHHLVASNTPYVFTWSIQTAAPCSVPPSQVTIHDDLPAIAGTLSSPVTTVCAGDGNTRTITLTGSQGNVVNWEYSINGTDYTPLSTPNTGRTLPFSNLTTPTWFHAIVKNGDACDMEVTDPILITVVDPPSIAVAGNPAHTCTDSYQLHGNTPTVGTGKWLPVAGITYDDPADPTTTAHGLIAGPNGTDYTFTWQISTTSTCEPSSDQVTITADPPAVAGTLSSTATTVCTDDARTQTITLKDNVGQVVNWEYSTNGVDYATVTPTNTSLVQSFSQLTTPTWFHAIVKNGGTCSVAITDPIFINVLQKPSESQPGHDDRLCAQDVYTLQGNTPAVGIGTWTAVPNVNFVDINDPGTRATGLVAGTTYQFTWTIRNKGTNGEEPCGYSSNFITVIDEPLPVATTTGAATVCSGTNAGQIKVFGQFTSVDSWQYSEDNGTTWQIIPGNTGLSVPYFNLTVPTQYRAMVVIGPKCGPTPSSITTINVVQPPPNADAGPPREVCGYTTYPLEGNDPGTGNTGKWTVVQGTGVNIIPDTDPHGVATGLIPGNTYQFKWTITSPGSACTSLPSTVQIIDDLKPVGGTTGSDAVVCRGQNDGLINLTGSSGVVDWQSSVDGGTTWTSTGNSGLSLPYHNITRDTWYRAVLTTICDAQPSTITKIIMADPPVTANPGQPLSICNQTSYILQGNDPGTGTGLWTVASDSDPAFIATPTDPHAVATGLSAGHVYKFIWTITGYSPTTDHPCGPSANTVTITDDRPPVIGNISPDVTVCNGNNNGNVRLQNQFGSIVWMSSTDGGNTWNPTGYITDTQPYAGLTRTTKYKAMLTNGSCGPVPSDIVTVYVADPPATADAGTSLSICNQTSYILQGSDPGTGTGMWTVAAGSDPANIATPTDPHAIATGLSANHVYKFTWTITGHSPTADNPCGTSSNTVTITDDLLPVKGDVTPDVTVCKTANSGSVSINNQLGTIVWMSSTDGGTTWNPTGYTSQSQPYFNITRTTQYKAMLTHGTCGPIPSDIVTVSVSDPPVTADPGQSLSICNQTSYILQGNDPGTGTGMWTVAAGSDPANIATPTDPHATATGLSANHVYKFTWTITGHSPTADNPCGTSSNTVTITDDLPPVKGDVTPDVTVCKATNSGSVSISNQLGTVVWMSSVDGGNTWNPTGVTALSQPYTALIQTTQYKAMITHGTCGPIPSDIITVYVADPPVTADAGTSLSICNETSYTLQGNDPGTGTGMWTVAAGSAPANILNPTDPHAEATGLSAGHVYKFTWTITGASPTADHPCDPSPNTVTITDDMAPVEGTASADAAVCMGDNHGSITLRNSQGNIQWVSSLDGHTWTPTGFTNTIQPYTNLTQTTQYRAIVTSGSSCGPAYSNIVTITVGQPPVPSYAGADQSICNETTYTLQGNNPAPGTGIWTLALGSDPAHIDEPANPHTTVSGLVAGGTYLFTWTTYGANPDGTVSVCTPSPTTVKITNDRLPVGGTTVGDATVCSGLNSGSITLTNSFGTIQWVKSTDNGITWVSTGNPNSTIQYYSNLTVPTQFMAILSNGSCGIKNSTITTINIGPAPTPSNPGPDDEVCSVTTYPLKAVLPAGATGMWTIQSGAGAHFDDPTDPTTTVRNLIPGNTYKFTWTISGTSPCAPIPGTVTIKDDLPADGGVATAVPAIICAGSSTVVTLGGQSGNILRWESSTDGTNWQPIYVTGQQQTFNNLMVPTQFRAISIGQGICGEVPSAAAIVTVNPTTIVSNPGKDDEVCNVKTYTLKGNSPLPNTGFWTITGGPAGATLDDPTDPKTTARGLVAGNTYQFTWTITGLAPCAPSSNAVNIKVDLQALGGTTSGATTVCAVNNDGFIYLKDWFGTIVKWVSSTDNGITWADVPNTAGANSYHYSGLTVPTQFKALVHQDGICGDVYSTATTITVNPQTVIANAGQNFNICNTNIAKLNGNNPAPFTGMWTQTAGPVVNIDNPASYQTVVRGLAKGNVYTFKWTITGLAPCGDTDAAVTIGAYEDVTPSFTQSQTKSCGPANVTFTNTSTPSPTGTFEWDFGDGTPIYTGVNPPTHSFAPSPNGNEITYTVRLTPTSNCGVQTPYVGTVKVSPAKPIASLLPGQISYCGTFSLTAKNMSPGNNAQYDFYMKDAKGAIVQHVRLNDTTTAVFQPITPTASTYYSVYVVATDFCGNQGTSSVINVAVAPSSIISGIQIKGDLQNICLGSPITFQNISTGGDRFMVTVYDNAQKAILRMPSGTGDQNYTPTAIGTYYVSITAGNTGCGDAPASELKPFNVYPAPVPAFADNIDNNYNVSFFNNTPDVTGIPAPSLNYVWDFGDGSQKEATYTPKQHHFDASRSPFTVTLTATTPGTECFSVTTKTIDIKFHGDLYVPNAFIPTSQNKQLNTYIVKGTGMKTWHMQIFNNFGQLIWESTKLDANGSPTEGWDGTYKGQIVEQGVYIWQISATLLNGEEWKGMSYNGSTPSKTGPIHLIR